MPTTEEVTAKQLAQQCGTDPKTMRKFLRDTLRPQGVETPGQGGRYSFTPKQAKKLRKLFLANGEAAKAEAVEGEVKAKKAKKAKKGLEEAVDITDLDIELELDDDGDAAEADPVGDIPGRYDDTSDTSDDEDAVVDEEAEEDASEEE